MRIPTIFLGQSATPLRQAVQETAANSDRLSAASGEHPWAPSDVQPQRGFRPAQDEGEASLLDICCLDFFWGLWRRFTFFWICPKKLQNLAKSVHFAFFILSKEWNNFPLCLYDISFKFSTEKLTCLICRFPLLPTRNDYQESRPSDWRSPTSPSWTSFLPRRSPVQGSLAGEEEEGEEGKCKVMDLEEEHT